MKNAIGIFCKFPEEGKVKTRLAEDIGDKKAVEVYKKLVQHSIDCCYSKAKFADLVVLFDPPEKFNDFIGWLSQKHYYLEQAKGDLGARLEEASTALLSSHYHIALIGSDCYNLSEELLRRTFDLLEKKDLVIGPAEDGGYYLIAFKAHHKELFENIKWSTASVLESTLKKAKSLKLEYHLLPKLSDIDTLDDLKKYPELYNEIFPPEIPKHVVPAASLYSLPPEEDNANEIVEETISEEATLIGEGTAAAEETAEAQDKTMTEENPTADIELVEEPAPEAEAETITVEAEEPALIQEPETKPEAAPELAPEESLKPEPSKAERTSSKNIDDDDDDDFEEGDFINPLYKLPPTD